MKFGYLDIKSFFRVKSLTVNLADPGLFAVLGKNEDTGESNEAGKSTIFEALCWCLWGRYAAGGARAGDEVVNPEVGKDCYVALEIWDGEDRYLVVRTRNHEHYGSILSIEKENLEGHDYQQVVQLTARNVRSTTKLIEDILGMNYETFVRGYYFPQEGVQSFGFMTDRGLKDFFLTELLDLSWIEDAHEKAKVHYRDLLGELKDIERGKEHANDRLEGLKLQIATLTLKKNGWIEDRNEKLKELGKEVRDEKDKLQTIEESQLAIEKKIKEYEQAIAILKADRDWSHVLGKADAKYLGLSNEVARLEPQIESLKKEIEECDNQIEQIDNLPGTNCNECGSLLDHSHIKFIKPKLVQRARELKGRWEALMMPDGKYGNSYQMKVRERDALEKEIEGLKKKMEEQEEKDKQIVELKEKLNSLENAANVEFIHRIIDDRKRQMVEKAKEKNPYVGLLEDVATKIKEANSKIVELDDQHTRTSTALSEVEFWVEAFSSQGIQSFVLDSVTHQLNRLIASYLVELSDGRISARFSTVTQNASGEWRERFKLEINNMDGGNSYTSLSGGAKRRVDVAVALAVSEYKRSHTLKELEFLVLDEATSGMDQYWTERFVTLLKNRLTNSAKYFITHQQLNSSWFDDTIVVVKRNGETVLLED